MTELDMNDPLIRQMVIDNHVPVEKWTSGNLISVHCDMCQQNWPCFTITKLRETRPPSPHIPRPNPTVPKS